MKLNFSGLLAVSLIVLVAFFPALATTWASFCLIFYHQLPLNYDFLTYLVKVVMLSVMGICLLLVLWKSYQAYQAVMLKQRVALLERLWQQSS